MIIGWKTIVVLYAIAMVMAVILGMIISHRQNRNRLEQEPAISVSNTGKPLRDSIQYLKIICK